MENDKETHNTGNAFSELKNFASQFVQLFPATLSRQNQNCTCVLAVSEAVLNWYLVPLIEDTEDAAKACAGMIQDLIQTTITAINTSQGETIRFEYQRPAIGQLVGAKLLLKVVTGQKNTAFFGQEEKPLRCFSVLFEDESETAETLEIAAV